MKNFRKIVAILSAVLMLCSVMPLSAFAAEGDVALSIDWNDGEMKFNVGEVVAEGPDGSNCYKWAFGGGYASNYLVAKNMDSTKDYTITMMAKGSVASSMGITIQNGDWGDYWNGPTFDVTTEWQEVVITLPANEIPFAAGSILFKFQGTGGSAYDLYVDDLVIYEGLPKVPLCENGDFENGDANWLLSQGSVVDATAAHSGSYGAHLISGANWNSMLERTFTVEAGKTYELSFWAKAVSGGSNIKFLDQNWEGAALASGIWFSSSEWTQKTVLFTAISDAFYFQFCGAGTTASELYVDDVTMIEIKDPSFDGYIYNGDFELGKLDFGTNEVNNTGAWVNLWGWTTLEQVEGHNGDYAIKGTANAWQQLYQPVAVTPNTNYTVICYSKDAADTALWIKNNAGQGDLTSTALNSGSDWGLTSLTFNSGANSVVWIGLMCLANGASYTVDDVVMFESAEQSNDGYLINGTFETGAVSPWNNLWGSCPKVEIVYGGHNDNFALHIVSGEWKHVRQMPIAVEPNTDYKLSVWAKDSSNMSLLVKGLLDDQNTETGNIVNMGINAGADWTEFTTEFNSGDHNYVLVSFMGCTVEGAYGTFDNIVMEKVEPACEHEYFYPCDPVCMICYEITNPDAAHNVLHVEAKDATCTENGNVEYWYCEFCGQAWLDADCIQITNQRNVIIPAAHTYDNNCDSDCNVCGEWRFDAPHNLTIKVEAVVPANCQEEGNPEYWICEDCDACFQADGVGGYYETNPAWLYYTGEHVRPEDSAPCAVVACELCGEDSYGEACTRPEGAPECTDIACVNCGEIIYGWGHNYNTGDEEIPLPLCGEGDCIYCGEHFDKLYDHENGSWAPCLDGECSYGCGLQYPATEGHVLEDCTAGGFCQVCWSYFEAGEHTYDDEFDVDCNVCGAVREVEAEVVYGDANGDGEINLRDVALLQQYTSNWEVTLDLAASDANGDGEVNLRDVALLQQYTSNWDVVLGPSQA